MYTWIIIRCITTRDSRSNFFPPNFVEIFFIVFILSYPLKTTWITYFKNRAYSSRDAQTERCNAFRRFMRDALAAIPPRYLRKGSRFIRIHCNRYNRNLFLFFLDCAAIMDNDIVRGCKKGTKNEEKNGKSRAVEKGDCHRRGWNDSQEGTGE